MRFTIRYKVTFVNSPPIHEDNPRVLASGLSHVQVGNSVHVPSRQFISPGIAPYEIFRGKFGMSDFIRIHHECEGGIEKIRPEDHLLASRGLPSDDKR